MKSPAVLVLSVILLIAVFFGAKAHAESRLMVIQELQDWQKTTQNRKDLEEREKDLRVQFINRLIFQVERKYQENSLREFLQFILEDMAETDRLKINQSFGSNLEFLEALALSLQNLLEQNEAPLRLIQEFTEYSGLSDPATMEEFADTRSYYDGRQTQGAQTVDLETATAIIEEKERELSPAEKNWIDFNRDLREEYLIELQATTA